MAERVVFASLWLFALVCSGSSQQTTAELAPGSFNAYLNQLINFTCVATEANGLLWFLNGNIAADNEFMSRGITPPPVNRNGATFQSDVSVVATEILHSLTLQCVAVPVDIQTPQVLSTISTLLVQGLLSSPENLDIAEEDSTHLRLSWDAPPTLDLTTIDPDISGYRVCSNVTSHCWPETKETEFSVPRLAVPVEWSVSALNVVGEGSPATVQQQPCSLGASSPLPSQGDISIEISFLSESRLELELQFLREEDCFPLYQLDCTLQSSGSQSSHGPALPSVVSGGTTSVTVTLELELELELELVLDERYSVQLSVSGGTDDPVLMNFTTYDVQRVDVVSEPGTIEVTCFFASGSQAQGCHVTIDLGNNNIVSQDVIRSGNADSAVHRQSPLDVGLYLVTVYDIESNGSIALDNPVVARSVSVSQPAPSVTPTPTPGVTTDPTTPVSPTTGVSSDMTATIAGAVLGSVLAVIAAVSLILILILWIRHKAQHSSEIVLQSNQVYDVMKQQQRSGRAVQLEPCSAYGVHGDTDADPEYETIS